VITVGIGAGPDEGRVAGVEPHRGSVRDDVFSERRQQFPHVL